MKNVFSSMAIATLLLFGLAVASTSSALAQTTPSQHSEVVIDVDSPLPASITLHKGDTLRFVRSKSDREVKYIGVSYTSCCEDEHNVPLFSAGREQSGVPATVTLVRPGKGHITFAYQPPFFLESPEWKDVQVTVLGAPNEAVPEEWHDPNAWKAFVFLFLLPVIAMCCFMNYLEGKASRPSDPVDPPNRVDSVAPVDLGDLGDAHHHQDLGDLGDRSHHEDLGDRGDRVDP